MEIYQKIQVEGEQYKNLRLARNFKNDLDIFWDLLNTNIENEKLKAELSELKDFANEKYEEIISVKN